MEKRATEFAQITLVVPDTDFVDMEAPIAINIRFDRVNCSVQGIANLNTVSR